MWSMSLMLPVRRSAGMAAARAMLGDRVAMAVAPPAIARNPRRLIGLMAAILVPAIGNSGRPGEESIESRHRPAIIRVTSGDAVPVQELQEWDCYSASGVECFPGFAEGERLGYFR
jgi:hypothetical protein